MPRVAMWGWPPEEATGGHNNGIMPLPNLYTAAGRRKWCLEKQAGFDCPSRRPTAQILIRKN